MFLFISILCFYFWVCEGHYIHMTSIARCPNFGGISRFSDFHKLNILIRTGVLWNIITFRYNKYIHRLHIIILKTYYLKVVTFYIKKIIYIDISITIGSFNQNFNQLHAVSCTQQGRQREPSVKTLCSLLSAEFWRYRVLSGRTQCHALPQHQSEEMEI